MREFPLSLSLDVFLAFYHRCWWPLYFQQPSASPSQSSLTRLFCLLNVFRVWQLPSLRIPVFPNRGRRALCMSGYLVWLPSVHFCIRKPKYCELLKIEVNLEDSSKTLHFSQIKNQLLVMDYDTKFYQSQVLNLQPGLLHSALTLLIFTTLNEPCLL